MPSGALTASSAVLPGQMGVAASGGARHVVQGVPGAPDQVIHAPGSVAQERVAVAVASAVVILARAVDLQLHAEEAGPDPWNTSSGL